MSASKNNQKKSIPALHSGSAIAVNSSAAQTLSSALKAYIEQNGLTPSLEAHSPEYRRLELAKARQSEKAMQIVTGFWLAQILAQEGQKAMAEAAAEVDLGVRAAFYSVARFGLFNSLGDLDAVQALDCVEPTKLRSLSLDRESAIALANGERVNGLTLEEVREMSCQEIVRHVRDNGETEALKRKLAAAEQKIQTLSHDTGRAKEGKEPLGLLVTREEAMAISERLLAEISQAKLLYERHLAAEGGDDERWRMDAGGAFYFAMLPAIKQGVEMLERLQKRFGVRLTGKLHEEFKLPPGSAEKFLQERESLLDRVSQAARDRAEARHRKHGLVGRPPKAGK